MNAPRDLSRFVVPPGCGAAFSASHHGGLVILRSLSEEALGWLREHVGDETSWNGDLLAIESRYFPDIVEAIIDAGFLFEGRPSGDESIH